MMQRQEFCHFLLWKLRCFMSTKQESHCSNYTAENTFYLTDHAKKTSLCCLWRYMKTQGPAKCKKRHACNLCNEFTQHCTESQWTHCRLHYPELARVMNRIWNNTVVHRLHRFSDGNLTIHHNYDTKRMSFDTTVPCSGCRVNKLS